MRILVASAQEDFDLPLAEAARKQVLAEAERYSDEGHATEILIVTGKRRGYSGEHRLPIKVVPRYSLALMARYLRRFDRLHFFGSTGLICWLLGRMMPQAERIVTLTDGGVFSVGRFSRWRESLAHNVAGHYDALYTYTDFQRKRFLSRCPVPQSKMRSTRPILTLKSTSRNVQRTSHPSLLYMGHLSAFKGIDIVADLFRNLVPEFPDLTLTIAANGLDYGGGGYHIVHDLQGEFGEKIALKGKVDPREELCRCHLYLYPVRGHRGTFAFPLSLYESLQCGTPFLSSALPGFIEYFAKDMLCDPGNATSFHSRAKEMLENPQAWRRFAENEFVRICKRVSAVT